MYGWLVMIINAERTQSYRLYTIKKLGRYNKKVCFWREMKYCKVIKRVWDPLPEGLKEKLKIETIGYRILKKPLMKEVQKLPITGPTHPMMAFLGYIFYGFCFHQTIHLYKCIGVK